MDNERPIEKLLRNYAKKRRADAGEPRELHPATRRLLQGEVARQFPKTQRGGSFLAAFFARPGLVYTVCVLAVAAVSVPLLLPTFRGGRPGSQQARAVVPDEADAKKLPAFAPAPPSVAREAEASLPAGEAGRSNEAGQTALAFADVERAKDDAGNFRLEQEKQKSQPVRTLTADAPARSAPAAPPRAPQIASRNRATLEAQSKLERSALETRADDARGLPLETRRTVPGEPAAVAGEKLGAARTVQSPKATDSPAGVALAARSPSVAPAPSAAAPVLADSTEAAAFSARYGLAQSAAAGVVQRFTQTQATGGLRPSTGADAAAARVLATFQVEQTGDQLRVIDSDGSTYTGSITSPVTGRQYGTIAESKGGTALAGKSAVPATSSPVDSNYQAGQSYFFRVAGTNRTVQQPVVFAGNILILTNAPPAGQTAQAPAARSQQQVAPAQNQWPSLLNSTISGNVQLGTNRELPIHAVPVDR